MTDDLLVTPTLSIPRTELVYRASRAGGAGGQHVNTSSTRIELLWAFEDSSAVDPAGKAVIRQKLNARIDAEGFLRVVAGNRRSQLQNRIAADERLAELVRGALHVAKTRKKTRPTRASKEARLSSKKKRSQTKGNRRRDDFD